MRTLLLVLPACALCSAAELVVDAGGSGQFTEIHAAMAAAQSGDTILVQPGAYTIDRPLVFGGKNVILRAPGGPSETVIRMAATPLDIRDASILIFRNGETASAVVEGFALTGGQGTFYNTDPLGKAGGAVLCYNGSSPTVRNCILSGNRAIMGGAICIDNSAPAFFDCTIEHNEVTYDGGALFCYNNARASFANCVFNENRAGRHGGGIELYIDCPLTFTDCAITRNRCAQLGGGITLDVNTSPRFTRCRIADNVSPQYGGGLLVFRGSSPRLDSCILAGNLAQTQSGGALACDQSSSPVLDNCLVYGNRAPSGGIAVCINSCSPVFNHCTLAGNRSDTGTHVLCLAATSQPRYNNSILCSNFPAGTFCGAQTTCVAGKDPRFTAAGSFNIESFASVEFGGATMLVPAFIVEEPDFHLQADSPAIDAGSDVVKLGVDFDGASRPYGAAPDAGAFEFTDAAPAVAVHVGDVNADATINIADAIALLAHLFGGTGTDPACRAACDVNNDGKLDIADSVRVLGYLFATQSMLGPDGAAILPGGTGCREYPAAALALSCDVTCNP